MTTASAGTAVQAAEPALRVVFADDSPAVRMLVKHSLANRKGVADVVLASDGAEALRMVELEQPDCVILDVEMPGMGGFEALAELQRRCPDVPVVLLSGFSDVEMADRARAGGAAAYLDKRSELMRLADTIQRVTSDGAPAAVQPSEPLPVPSPVAAGTAAADSRTNELRKFEYAVSHDFAEPLRTIAGFAGLLSSHYAGALDERGRLFLEQVTSGARRMQSMMDDLLTYTRAGRAEPEIGRVALADVLPRVVDGLAGRIRAAGAVVTVGRLPVVTADERMVETIFTQLITNSLVFNRSRPPAVHVEGRAHDGRAEVTVRDNGIGMDPSRFERAIDLFGRLNTRDEFPGNGVGLALCRRLAQLQEGSLELASAPSRGTTATLTLRAAPDARDGGHG